MSDPVFGIGVEECIDQFVGALRPPPNMFYSDWADENRELAKVGSSESGKWKTSRTPYLKEIMDCLSPKHPCKEVAFMKPSQIGGTEALINAILASLDLAPGPILCVQPTEKMAKRFIKQRVNSAIAAVSSISEKMTSDSLLEKEFLNGMLMMAWSNSAANLRSMPIRYLFLDEIDNYDEDCEGEGDPVELAVARTENFANRKIFYNSTPNMAETSRINAKYEDGDQRIYEVPCPCCGAMFEMDWTQLICPKDKTGKRIWKNLHLKCPHCDGKIKEYSKTKMMAHGVWVPQNPDGDYPSFRINALYSPLGWYSWEKMFKDFLKAQRQGSEKLKVWVNTKRGLPWEDSARAVKHSFLHDRREEYGAEVPEDVLLLTAGIDVQDDRLEAEVVGWGREYESWSIDYRKFYGPTDQPEVWKALSDWLRRSFEHETGLRMHIAAACIDAMGHRTEEVYKFTKPREPRRIYAIQGKGGVGLPIIGKATSPHRIGARLFPVGVDSCKSELQSALLQEVPGTPHYCHFPLKDVYDEEYFLQLTAEKRVLKKAPNGARKLVWEKKRLRNEALDCRNYARAALEITGIDLEALYNSGPYCAPLKPLASNRSTRRRSKGVQA